MQHDRTSNSKEQSRITIRGLHSPFTIYLALRAVMKAPYSTVTKMGSNSKDSQNRTPHAAVTHLDCMPPLHDLSDNVLSGRFGFSFRKVVRTAGRPVGRSINMTNAGTSSCPHRLSPQHQRHGQAFGTHSWIEPRVHSCFAHGVFGVSKGIHGVSLS